MSLPGYLRPRNKGRRTLPPPTTVTAEGCWRKGYCMQGTAIPAAVEGCCWKPFSTQGIALPHRHRSDQRIPWPRIVRLGCRGLLRGTLLRRRLVRGSIMQARGAVEGRPQRWQGSEHSHLFSWRVLRGSDWAPPAKASQETILIPTPKVRASTLQTEGRE